MMTNDKFYLERTLGILLGFDDGASDVLEHLLTIESKDVCFLAGSMNIDGTFYSNT